MTKGELAKKKGLKAPEKQNPSEALITTSEEKVQTEKNSQETTPEPVKESQASTKKATEKKPAAKKAPKEKKPANAKKPAAPKAAAPKMKTIDKKGNEDKGLGLNKDGSYKQSNAGRKSIDSKQKKKQVTLTLYPETSAQLEKWTANKRKSVANYLSDYIEEHLDDIKKYYNLK